MEKDDRVAIISGGSRGLGAALVTDLLSRGYRIATFSRNETPFVREHRARDPEAHRFYWAAFDGTDATAVADFVRAVDDHFGRIDALVNNAAVARQGLLTLMRSEAIAETLASNIGALISLTREVVKRLLARNAGGCIVNISSVNGLRGRAGLSVYSATKAAVDGMTRSLARELGPAGIRVNSVAPGFFESEMVRDIDASERARVVRRTPLGRLGRADDMAGIVRFLLSEDATFITGQTIIVDGGLTC